MSPAVVADQTTKSERDKQNMKKRKNKEEGYNASSLAAKGEDEREKKPRKNSLITDTRFASAQLDPRFQIMRKREAKVPIDSRFARMLSDRSFSSSAAPVDKRGKPRKRDGVNPLLHYYLHEKEPEVDRVVEEDEEVPLDSRFFSSSAVPVDKRGKPRKSNEVNPLLHSYLHEKDPEVEKVVEDDEELESERVEENGEKVSSSLDGGTDESTSTTDDEDDDDDDDYVNSDLSRYLMANHEDTPTIEQETHRLAIVNMDWDHIKSVDLYVVMSSCLPKGGQILSVTIYPSEFGLKRMEVEAVRGPTSLIDVDEELSEEEADPEVINEKLRAYELKKLSYYYAVAVFNSSATANHVYNTLDGTELTRTSNVFDLRFIPDYMEFKHPPRDVTEEAPTSYKEPDFQTRALQHYKVNLTWEDDEPQRVTTLRRKFNVEKLDDLNEYLASTDDSDDEHEDIEKLRALLQPNNNSDTDPSENDKDMEITFNTGLEDLSKRILEKKGKKNETVWDQVLRRQSEKRKAKKNRSKYSSDDDISDSDLKEAPEHPDDFFVEDSSDTNIKAENKKNKGSKDRMKHKKGKERPQEIEKEQEAGRAELELLFAEDEGIDKGPKGYNMKSKKIKGKKAKEFSSDEKLPNVDCSNDPRFAALYNNHLYALDPTDPHFKRSVAFARQKMQKQIGSKEKDEEEASDKWKQASVSSADDIDLVKGSVARLENEKHEFSSIIRSLKRNIGNMKK